VKDLTQGSIVGHIATMAMPLAIGMLAQIAYQLIDLYFVTQLGAAAIAGANAASNIVFVMVALTQVLATGTVALVAHALGRKDHAEACLIFRQSMLLAVLWGVTATVLIAVLARPYMSLIAADAAVVEAGTTFVLWVLPGYALTFPMAVLSAALRGAGVAAPAVTFNVLTVMLNAVLAPILIAGWGTGEAFGLEGAGAATSLSIAIGFIAFCVYCHRVHRWMGVDRIVMKPRIPYWRRILSIGLPAGLDFALFFFYTAGVYYAIREFGVAAQAGFGIGSRILQTIAMPGLAIGFAAGPIAGQNFGAMRSDRVKETFLVAALLGAAAMIVAVILVQWQPGTIANLFEADASTISAAIVFLQLTSWALVAQGLVCTCSSMFQGFGNTMPSLVSSGVRLLSFIIPVGFISIMQPAFRIEQVWYLSVASLALQAIVSLWLVRVEFGRRLPPADRARSQGCLQKACE
jgi:putative MATE family efflux protein